MSDTADPEMNAINAINEALTPLDSPARSRVLTWACARFTQTNAHPTSSRENKRDAALEIMRERPGRWTPADMREALKERGIDPHQGTPVKNILWHLAKAGTISAAGGGVYEFPPLTVPLENGSAASALP